MQQDLIDAVEPVADVLTGAQRIAYDLALTELRQRQQREHYELRLQHCHERLQLLHSFDASHSLTAKFWRRHMERITRRFQAQRRGGTNSTVNL